MKPTTPRRTRRLLARAATMNHAEEYDDYGPEPNMKLSHAFLVVLALHVVAVGGLYAFNTIKAGNHAVAKTEAKNAPVAEKAMPPGDKSSPAGGSGDQGDNRPPLVSKPAPVAKVSKQTQPARSAEKPSQPSRFSLANLLGKLGTGGAAAAGSSELAAQEPAPAAAAPEPAPAGGAQSYTVKAGDTVTKIASSLGVTIPDLEKANGLSGNTVLQVGQILKVPANVPSPAAAVAARVETVKIAQGAAPSPATAPLAVSGPTADYTVVKGDNPWKIAKKFKISQDELMKANGITDPKKIQIGQVLKIPASTGKAK